MTNYEPLERIVKVDAPLTGTYDHTFNEKKQVAIPSDMRKIYSIRQKKSEGDCLIYARSDEKILGRLTDNPEESECSDYKLVSMDSSGRIVLPFEIGDLKKVRFIGLGDYVELHRLERDQTSTE